MAEVGETELVVIKPGADLPNADRAFYRVVAVDENGNRSGPSDYAEAPRPLITTVAHEAVEVGAAYEYQPHAIRSLGDLRSKSIEGKGSYNAHFWNIEKPAWSLVDAPGWLSVDPETGVVSGTPTEAGTFTAMLRVEIDGVGTDEQRLTIPVE